MQKIWNNLYYTWALWSTVIIINEDKIEVKYSPLRMKSNTTNPSLSRIFLPGKFIYFPCRVIIRKLFVTRIQRSSFLNDVYLILDISSSQSLHTITSVRVNQIHIKSNIDLLLFYQCDFKSILKPCVLQVLYQNYAP